MHDTDAAHAAAIRAAALQLNRAIIAAQADGVATRLTVEAHATMPTVAASTWRPARAAPVCASCGRLTPSHASWCPQRPRSSAEAAIEASVGHLVERAARGVA